MNAMPQLLQSPSSNEALNLNLSEPSHSLAPQANREEFAVALNEAHAQPARKNITKDQHRSEPSGRHLPQPGNPTPLAVPAETTEATPARHSVQARADRAPGIGAPAGVANRPGTPAPSAAAATLPASVAHGVAPPSNAAAPQSKMAAAAPNPVNPLAAGDQELLTAAALLVPGAPATAAAVRITSAPAASGAATPAVLAGKADPTIAVATATSAATAAPASSSVTLNGAVAPKTDYEALAVMVPAQDNASPLTNSPGLAVADPASAVGVPIAPGLAAGSTAPESGPPSAATVTAAATAASIAQVISAAGAQAGADKHSRGGGSDSSLPGASNDGAAAALLLNSANPTTAESPTPAFKVSASVDSAEFGQGVANHVGIMMDGNLSSAKLQVNPPALGPIEVRIALQAGHAQVWLTSHSAITRDALESSAPKLREMLGAQGFAEVSVDISQRSFQERSPQPRGYEEAAPMTPDALAGVGNTPAHTASGLLDAYA